MARDQRRVKMHNLEDLINAMNLFEPDEYASPHEDSVVERLSVIKPPGKGDSGMAEER